jgi:hypothetical protein
MTKKILSTLVGCLLSTAAFSQSTAETMKYLNDKLNSDACQIVKMQGQKIVWSLTSDGRLITKRIHRGGYVMDTKSYYLKTLCGSMSCTTMETMKDELGINDGQPTTYLVFGGSSDQKLIIAFDSEEPANRVRNAVFHLVALAKANKSYKGKDPFDY